MFHFSVYLFPALVNFITGGIFFFSAYSFTKMEFSGFVVGCTTASWAIIYALFSYVAGLIVTEKNSPYLVVIGASVMTCASLLYLAIPDAVYLQFIWIAMGGLGGAIYCTPFQVFMKSIESKNQNVGAVRASGLYEVSWSFGLGAGPFIFAILNRTSAFSLMAAAGVIVAAGTFVIARYARKTLVNVASENIITEDKKTSGFDELDYSKYPNMVLTGWIIGGLGSIAVNIIRSLEPFRGQAIGLDETQTGLALALLSGTQALTALLLLKSKTWMFKPSRAFLFGICGVAGLLCFGIGKNMTAFIVGAILFGIFYGCLCFLYVFYVIVHRTKSSKYFSVNEMVMGFSGIAGPLSGGLLAGAYNADLSGIPFIASSLLVAGAVLFHILSLRFSMKKHALKA